MTKIYNARAISISSNSEEQSGYYFPFHLTKTGTKMTFKKNGTPTKENIPFDADIIFRVVKGDTFEVLVDDKSVVKFTFAGAKFEAQASGFRAFAVLLAQRWVLWHG